MKLNKLKLAMIIWLGSNLLFLTACNSSSPPGDTNAGCTSTVDTDGDGLTDCFELETSHTLVKLADTDGDGRNDGYEYDHFDPATSLVKFNPRIADIPEVKIELNQLPSIELLTQLNGATSDSITTGYETSNTSSIDLTKSNSMSTQVASTLSSSASLMVGAEYTFGVTAGATIKGELTASLGYERSEANGSEVSWSQSEQQEKSNTYNRGQELVKTQGYTLTGGKLSNVNFSIKNTGHIAYKISNLVLTVQSVNPLRPTDPKNIGRLNTDTLVADIPGGTTTGAYSYELSDSLTVATTNALLRSSDNLVIKPASYVLDDINGSPLLLHSDEIDALTATISIDYGSNGGVKNYRIAVRQNEDKNTISVTDALTNILHLDMETGKGEWNYPQGGLSATGNGLLRIGSTAHNALTNQFWQVAHYHAPNGVNADKQTELFNVVLNDYDFNTMQLAAGDKLVITYVGDADRDGINDRTEIKLGTNKDNADSDGDGLIDSFELFGWQSNLSGNPADCDSGKLYTISTNPLKADTDADGKSDKAEYDSCENPVGSFIAIAGDDQQVIKGATVQLNGGTGTVGQNLNLEYKWNLKNGLSVRDDLGNVTSVLEGQAPSFTANDHVETLVFDLVITDLNNTESTSTDQVVINVLKDPANAIFIGAPNGTPDGSPNHPYSNIASTVNANPGSDFYIMADKYHYLQGTLTVPKDSSLFGGYDANWVRKTSFNANGTRLYYKNKGARQPVLKYNEISKPVWLSGFNLYSLADGGPSSLSYLEETTPGNGELTPASVASVSNLDRVTVLVKNNAQTGHLTIRDNYIYTAPVDSAAQELPGTSYGVFIDTLNTLTFNNNFIISGNGGNTIERPAPQTLTAAGGSPGVGDQGGTGGDSNNHLAADNGGNGGFDNTVTGPPPNYYQVIEAAAGYNAINTGSGCGHGGGAGTDSHPVGYPGETGCTGHSGNAGDGSTINLGNLADLDLGFISTLNGTAGTNGKNGGGGGGGGAGADCLLCQRGAGGGGGEGGQGGWGAYPGFGGGASIGLWLNNVTFSTITGNTINTKTGGTGGLGAYTLGAPGGRGGAGGDARTNKGGPGGHGGIGGNSGRGGGGAGGPSIGIFLANGVETISDWSANTMNVGNGGLGGCGNCASSNGTTGASLGIFNANSTSLNMDDTIFSQRNTINYP